MERDIVTLGLEDRLILEVLRKEHPEVFLNIKKEVAPRAASTSLPSRAATPCADGPVLEMATPRSLSPLSRAASDAATIRNAV
ncbi:unnamed protein product [Leptosia nina]|uniref:Uncharacterized protein n=1 Tax=Leptosia nina TaxID=320188 RepID=A0AAV1JYG8_9NEOP